MNKVFCVERERVVFFNSKFAYYLRDGKVFFSRRKRAYMRSAGSVESMRDLRVVVGTEKEFRGLAGNASARMVSALKRFEVGK